MTRLYDLPRNRASALLIFLIPFFTLSVGCEVQLTAPKTSEGGDVVAKGSDSSCSLTANPKVLPSAGGDVTLRLMVNSTKKVASSSIHSQNLGSDVGGTIVVGVKSDQTFKGTVLFEDRQEVECETAVKLGSANLSPLVQNGICKHLPTEIDNAYLAKLNKDLEPVNAATRKNVLKKATEANALSTATQVIDASSYLNDSIVASLIEANRPSSNTAEPTNSELCKLVNDSSSSQGCTYKALHELVEGSVYYLEFETNANKVYFVTSLKIMANPPSFAPNLSYNSNTSYYFATSGTANQRAVHLIQNISTTPQSAQKKLKLDRCACTDIYAEQLKSNRALDVASSMAPPPRRSFLINLPKEIEWSISDEILQVDSPKKVWLFHYNLVEPPEGSKKDQCPPIRAT